MMIEKKVSKGEKFNTADLLGMPMQIIVGQQESKNNIVIVKNRKSNVKTAIALERLYEMMKMDE